MARDYFAILGLTPGRYDPSEITRQFGRVRSELLADLARAETRPDAERRLADLHVAYAALREPHHQQAHLSETTAADGAARMRRLIGASLEGGLLRYSQRQRILQEGRALGFSDFQTQLLIAQVQFGDEEIEPIRRGGPPPGSAPGLARRPPHACGGGARLATGPSSDRKVRLANGAAIVLLATAIFLIMLDWVSG